MTEPGPPAFSQYQVELEPRIVAQRFDSRDNPDVKLMFNILRDLYLDHRKEHEAVKLRMPGGHPGGQWRSREDLINEKRQQIALVLQNQDLVNLKAAARMCRASYEMVRGVHRDLLADGQASTYVYPNQKTEAEMACFNGSLARLQGSYSTIADLRRQNPHCSRRWIGLRLKCAGYKWRKLRRNRKNPKKENPNVQRIVGSICHLVQAHVSPGVTVVFIDEAHFPLYQTSDHRWTLGLHHDDLFYNRRPAPEEKLSVVAACTLSGFVAMQVFPNDVTKEDFLYFLQTLMARFGAEDRVTVLADNASWHTSPVVTESLAGKYLYFNSPGLFRINAIENSFSFARSEFRKRPLVQGIQEEARLLVNIFHHEDNARRFVGIHKNHLRQMLLLLRDHCPELQHIRKEDIERY